MNAMEQMNNQPMGDALAYLEAHARPALRPQPKRFSEMYPKESEWIKTSAFDFAVKMKDVLDQWGWLTERQLLAVQKCMDSERTYAERKSIRGYTPEQTAVALRYAAAEQPTAIDLTKVPSGYYSVPDGATRLKVRIDRGTGRWQGYIFVTDGAVYGQQRQYGKQAPGGAYVGLVQDAIKAIVADPQAASRAYGRLTGSCGVCGRHLEDEQSVAAGIGPICAGRLGW